WLDSSELFHKEVCDCEECRETLNGDPSRFTLFGEGEVKDILRGRGMVRIEFPSTETKRRCLKHYLQRKQREYQMSSGANPQEPLKELEDSINKHKPFAGSDGIAHLVRWKCVLDSIGSSS
ncbi:MAG: hypothetical protein V2A61_07625, partial [Calditrichota bacterium]